MNTSSSTAGDACTELDTVLAPVGFEPACWEWIREDPSGWRIADETLELRSLPGSLWLDQNSTRNIAVRPIPEGEGFTVEVHVAGPLGNPAEQGGLKLYVDDDNYIKLVKERVGPQRAVVMVTESDGDPVVDGFIGIQADEAWLRLVVTPERVRGFMRSGPAEPELDVADVQRPSWADATTRIGLFSQAADAERWLSFDQLRVSTQ